jgi:hypothetical protein
MKFDRSILRQETSHCENIWLTLNFFFVVVHVTPAPPTPNDFISLFPIVFPSALKEYSFFLLFFSKRFMFEAAVHCIDVKLSNELRSCS